MCSDMETMNSITVKAPAKLNLFLKILGRRPDGCHTIETLFEKINLFDLIHLEKRPSGIELYADTKEIPPGKGNLAFRAAEALAEKCGRKLPVKIGIKKSIPVGAGLGGGSSDAAAVLKGLNLLYKTGLDEKGLMAIGEGLGADVPLFIPEASWAAGRERGDKIEVIVTDMRLWHILIVPPFSISSREAYEWIDKNPPQGRVPDIEKAFSGLRDNDVSLLGGKMYNGLEGIAIERSARLKAFKNRLTEYGAKGALISGSGPCLFGITKKKKEVTALKKRLEIEMKREDQKWQIIIASTLDEK